MKTIKEPLYFKQMYFGITQVRPGTTQLITETDENRESITQLREAEAVKWLFRNQEFASFFISEFFSSGKISFYFEVQEPLTHPNKKPGDIDLLLVNTETPHRAVAFECKRVKAVYFNEGESKINGSKAVVAGIKQANAYRELGFHKTYFVIIILDDARASKLPNIMMRSNMDEVKHIYHIPWDEPLHDDIGIVYIKISQPTGKTVETFGGLGICVDRAAQPLDQTPLMTNKIKEIIKRSGH